VAHEKAYFVVVAQVGSNVMLVHRSSDKKLAYEVASGQPDGTGFVLEVSRDTDPGIAGGMEVEARRQAEQMEGEASTFLRPRSVLTEPVVDQQPKDPKEGAATARRAADLKENREPGDRTGCRQGIDGQGHQEVD
jgi:hypothetical protein